MRQLDQTQEHEINRVNSEQQQLKKRERQRRKSQKLKLKQQYRPDFQRRIKRPIYCRYDYRKVRSQLLDDNIFTSHQLTINRKTNEVIIGFKTDEEQEHARTISKTRGVEMRTEKQKNDDRPNRTSTSRREKGGEKRRDLKKIDGFRLNLDNSDWIQLVKLTDDYLLLFKRQKTSSFIFFIGNSNRDKSKQDKNNFVKFNKFIEFKLK